MYNQYYNILRTFATGRIELIRFVALTGFRVASKIWWCLRSTLQTNNENNPINHLSSIKNPETMGLRGRFVRGYFHFFFAVTWCNSPIHTFIYIYIYDICLFVTKHVGCMTPLSWVNHELFWFQPQRVISEKELTECWTTKSFFFFEFDYCTMFHL